MAAWWVPGGGGGSAWCPVLRMAAVVRPGAAWQRLGVMGGARAGPGGRARGPGGAWRRRAGGASQALVAAWAGGGCGGQLFGAQKK